MNDPNLALVGPGHFKWNCGAWFGASLGSSMWMMITASILSSTGQKELALVPAVGFACIGVASVLLWNARGRLMPYPALMGLMALLGIVVPVVWLGISLMASTEVLDALHWPTSIWVTLLVAGLTPAIMLRFYFLEHAAVATRTA